MEPQSDRRPATSAPAPRGRRARALPAALAALLGLVLTAAASPVPESGTPGADPTTAAPGGTFLAPAESLGFAAYASLSRDQQLERREQAKRWLRRASGKSPAAAQHDYATAVGLCPFHPEAWLLYAGSQHLQGNYAAADRLLQHVRDTLRYEASERQRRQIEAECRRMSAEVAYNLGDLARATEEVERALAATPDDAELLLLQARVLVGRGEGAAARDVLGRIDHQSPSYASALAVLGLIQMQDGELESAARTFGRAHELGMRGAIFENDRGRLALEMGRTEEAARRFQEAIELAPTMMEARNNLAVAQRRGGDLSAAEQTLIAALDRNPTYAPAHFNLAELYRERCFLAQPPQRDEIGQEAIRHYGAAEQLGYRVETVLERSSGVALAIGDLDGAEAMLLKVTESPQASGRVIFLLARVKKQQGQLKIAQKLCEMAVERGFTDAAVYSDLGEVLLRQSNPQAAREPLQHALQINPDMVATRINLCVALSQLGDLAGAEQVLRRAEELAPQDPAVLEQRANLRRLSGQ